MLQGRSPFARGLHSQAGKRAGRAGLDKDRNDDRDFPPLPGTGPSSSTRGRGSAAAPLYPRGGPFSPQTSLRRARGPRRLSDRHGEFSKLGTEKANEQLYPVGRGRKEKCGGEDRRGE